MVAKRLRLLSGLSCLFLLGCAGPHAAPDVRAMQTQPRERVVGSYTAADGSELVFSADGIYVERFGTGQRTGNWQLADNRLKWTVDGQKREAAVVQSDERGLEIVMLEPARLIGGPEILTLRRSR
jgi:hypothetical protein